MPGGQKDEKTRRFLRIPRSERPLPSGLNEGPSGPRLFTLANQWWPRGLTRRVNRTRHTASGRLKRGAVQVGAYLRVSSASQTLETQRDAIERCARARGDVVVTWFSERASARTTDRPELKALKAAAARGELSKVYVYRLDRLCRSGIRDTLVLLEHFRHYGVPVETVADGFSPTGPAGDVVIAVLAWAAQIERLANGERISAARGRLAAEGRPWGRPTRFKPTQIEKILAMRAKRVSIREIARKMRLPRTTVQDFLARHGRAADVAGKLPKPGVRKAREKRLD